MQGPLGSPRAFRTARVGGAAARWRCSRVQEACGRRPRPAAELGDPSSDVAAHLEERLMTRIHARDGLDGHSRGATRIGDASDAPMSVEHQRAP
eukprot:scaffold87891_cov23-Tisochrysis_lutea.AAC.5